MSKRPEDMIDPGDDLIDPRTRHLLKRITDPLSLRFRRLRQWVDGFGSTPALPALRAEYAWLKVLSDLPPDVTRVRREYLEARCRRMASQLTTSSFDLLVVAVGIERSRWAEGVYPNWCAACGRVAPLVDNECLNCRH